MTPEERDAMLAYVSEIEGVTVRCARHFGALQFLLIEKGLITGDEFERALKTVEAALAVEEATDPRFEQLDRLRRWIEEQK